MVNNENQQLKTIPIPRKVFDSMIEAYQRWAEFSDEFEDFLLASDEKFIEKMRGARKEHLEGKIRDLQSLKQELR